MSMTRNCLRVVLAALAVVTASQVFAAEGGVWSVSKSSGEVWIGNGDVQQASLKVEDQLKPGDTIRTGRNGRVLLVRGEESILIAPNSVVGLPTEQKQELSTTIVQRAGSILLEVEKRNVKHFEVETPYLAAVVKGTQFRVSVNAGNTKVDVMRGQVEVADFKSGQIAQVMPGQSATVFQHGKAGLSLSGAGTFNPIEQGKPRAPSVDRIPVPKGGWSGQRTAGHVTGPGTLRIHAALGEVKLDFHKVTHGLARASGAVASTSRNIVNNNTVWGSGPSGGVSTEASASSNGNSSSNSASSTSAAVAAATNAGSANNGNGNGNNNGNGNPANGNGNGNGGVGNGHGIGNRKH